MKIAIHGLGRMGMQIAHCCRERQTGLSLTIVVVPINRHQRNLLCATAAYTKQDVLAAFGDDQVVLWIMLPADVVDAEVDEWLERSYPRAVLSSMEVTLTIVCEHAS